MATRTVLFGSNTNGNLYAVDQGNQDAGSAYNILAKSASVYPAGQGGEAVFKTLYLTLTWTMGVTLKITPILDGWKRSELAQTITVPAVTDRTVRTFELSLKQSFYVPNAALTGTVSVNKYDKTVSGNLTSFTTELAVGDLLMFGSNDGIRVHRVYKVAAIASNTSLTLEDYYDGENLSGVELRKNPSSFGRTHLRGSELAIQIETENGLSAGDLALEAVEVDVTVVRESQESK